MARRAEVEDDDAADDAAADDDDDFARLALVLVDDDDVAARFIDRLCCRVHNKHNINPPNCRTKK